MLLGGLACEARETAETGPPADRLEVAPPSIERPALELAGCRHREGPRCHLAAGREATVVVWLDLHGGAELEASLDGAAVEAAPLPVEGGLRLSVEVPPTARTLLVEGVDPRWSTAVEIDFVREPLPSFVVEAETAAPAKAVEGLRAGLVDEAEPLARLAAMQLLRRHLVALDHPKALAETEATAALARELGRERDFADAAAAAAFLRLSAQDLIGARAWTEQLRALAQKAEEAEDAGRDRGAAEIPVWAHYQLGLLASRTGDLGAAVEHLDEARRAARRVALHDELTFASEMLGVTYAELGRGARAYALNQETLAQAPELRDCRQRAELYANIGWASLLLAEAGFDHHDPRALFEAQIELIGPEGACPDPTSMSFARVNLALVALADREFTEAREWIAPLTFDPAPSYLAPWIEEVSAQIGVGTGSWELVPALVVRPAPDSSEPGLRWTATVRQAETFERLGLVDAALASYMEAEAILERTLSSVGVSLGRELFLAGRQTSAQRLVELLLRRGEEQAALCRARLARGRALRTLDRSSRIAALSPAQRREREAKLSRYLAIQAELAAAQREDWAFSGSERERRARQRDERLAEAEALLDAALRGGSTAPGASDSADPCAGLPPIEAGGVLLMQFPREEGSWLFVADASEVAVIEAPDPRDKAWPEDILSPEAGRIAAAERVHVIPTGAGWSIDFHALRVGSGVLLEVAPLIYSLDLHPPAGGPPSPGRGLGLANPSEDLDEAQAEAAAVAERLSGRAWKVRQHVGAEVTRATFEDEVVWAQLLHYAGHGVHRGADGWQAALLLHESDVFSVSDILALPEVPAGVVLTGCDTTSVAQGTLAGGMNLGRAFVLAGADWVIGADGKVDDALARALGEALYAESLGDLDHFDGPAALREAQLELRARDPSGRWRAFRAVGP